MSPNEYKALMPVFLTKLNERLKADGYTFEAKVLQQLPDMWIILVLNEVYQLYCDGNRANWEWVGYMDTRS